MLNISNPGSNDENEPKAFNLIPDPADPNDPNSPNIPQPGDDPDVPLPEYLHRPPEQHELTAITGANVGGVAGELSAEVIMELRKQGLSLTQIKTTAIRYGLSVGQAAAFALGRAVANQLNQAFSSIFGGGGRGGGGGDNFITFYAPNSGDGSSGPGGPSGPSSPGGPNAHHPQLHNHLDSNGKPGEVEVGVGIKVPGYVPYFKEFSSNYTSPLHVTCALIQMPTLQDYTLGKFNYSSIILRFIDRVARSISYQLDPNTFTAANVNSYFNNILKGLAVYYWYESIYAYTVKQTDLTNDALVWLRRNISADTLNSVMILRSTLASLPIPPNMVKLVCWMYQNWQIHSLGDSPVIKICPLPILTSTGLPDPSGIDTITNTLCSATNRSITSTLVKSFDEWSTMDLPPSSITLEHNADFTTLWANLPYTVKSTAAPTIDTSFPNASTTTSQVAYQTFTDELDGFVIGMCGIYDTSKAQWAPTFLSSVTNSTSDSLSSNRFYWSGSTNKFLHTYTNPVMSFQRPETFIVTPGFANSSIFLGPTTVVHNPFAERIYGINIDAISEAGMQLLQWMLNFENFSSLSSSAGPVMPSAPRGKALSPQNNKKPSWTRKKRSSTSPETESAVKDQFGEL